MRRTTFSLSPGTEQLPQNIVGKDNFWTKWIPDPNMQLMSAVDLW